MVKEYIPLDMLEKYGFKKGSQIHRHEEFCKEGEERDYWLVSTGEDEEVYFAFGNSLLWSIHIKEDKILHIECVPDSSYRVSGYQMERMFSAIYQMSMAGILKDTLDDNK